jgi:two-component system, NarL family, response regulator NreC
MIQVLLVDRHAVILRNLRHILQEAGDCEVCGEAAEGEHVVEVATQLKPDLVVLDIDMPGLKGLETIRRIRRVLPQTEFVILTTHDPEGLVREVLAAGARSYIRTADAMRYLVGAVRALARHEPYFTPELPQHLFEAFLDESPGAAGRSGAT